MKELLKKNKTELETSLQELLKQQAVVNEQIIMHQGAIQYNDRIIKELEEKDPEEKPTTVSKIKK